ncbi:MAG: carboxylesterase family protein [Pseudomonadota bacterium]
MQNLLRHIVSRGVLACAVLALASCGSDTITNGPEGPDIGINQAPMITSSANANVPENSRGTVYTAAADDPDGDALMFTLEGADASQFSIDSASGEVAFVSAPDFEAPMDSDGDNAYQFTVEVRDPSGATDRLSVTINVIDETETSQRYVDEVFATLEVQRGIEYAPGLFLDLYSPDGDTVTNRPVMIVASGGGFIDEDRGSVEPIARAFARRGYVAATIDYRVLGRQPANAEDLAIAGIEATHDMFAAVRFFRADAEGANSFGVRSDAIFVSGESAGGVMAAIAATIDPGDTIATAALRAYVDANGGPFGAVGGNASTSSAISGAMPLSGAILELGWVDTSSAVLFAAHEEFDPVVPCGTAAEGSSNTGLIVSGGCATTDAYQTQGARSELFLVMGSSGHVEFTEEQRRAIYAGAARLFFDAVISQ